MSTLTALASANSTSACTITNASNAYSDTNDTTYASMNYSAVGYARFSGFNFSSIPDGSTINSITYKLKGYNGFGTLTGKAYINGSEKASVNINTLAVFTLTVSNSATLANLKANSANNYMDLIVTSAGSGQRAYGFEIIVDYTAPVIHDITASAGDNGSISPSGTVNVTQGNNQQFTITPNEGYLMDVLTVDGSPTSPTTTTPAITYTFSSVSTTHSISVTFKPAYDLKRAFHAMQNEILFGGL